MVIRRLPPPTCPRHVHVPHPAWLSDLSHLLLHGLHVSRPIKTSPPGPTAPCIQLMSSCCSIQPRILGLTLLAVILSSLLYRVCYSSCFPTYDLNQCTTNKPSYDNSVSAQYLQTQMTHWRYVYHQVLDTPCLNRLHHQHWYRTYVLHFCGQRCSLL
jgi:hypothetical protein